MKEYDLLVIGSGPGGYVAAIRAAQLGLKTACIEKGKTLGGTCLNVGCIPSKSLLAATELYAKVKSEGEAFGLIAPRVDYDFPKMQERKEKTVAGFTRGIEGLFQKNKIERFTGEGRLEGPHTASVGGETLSAKTLLLATGSEPISLPFLPFDERVVLSSTGALALTSPPKELLVIGAGIIGVELGSVYARLGTKVTFIEFLDRICPSFDLALSKGLQKSLQDRGMTFLLSHKVTSASIGSGVTLTLQGPSGEQTLSGEKVLVAVGRRPYHKNLNLEKVGVQTDSKGFVVVNDAFQTTCPSIYAIGDLIDGPMLAHKASEEGVAVAELLAGHRPSLDYLSIPGVAYTSPEVAAVGLTEEEVKQRKIAYRTSQFPFKANSRARCTGEEEGFVKLIAEEKSRRLLGVHLFGPHASELIAEGALALQQRLTADEFAQSCRAHPTLAEAVKEGALALFGKPIHL